MSASAGVSLLKSANQCMKCSRCCQVPTTAHTWHISPRLRQQPISARLVGSQLEAAALWRRVSAEFADHQGARQRGNTTSQGQKPSPAWPRSYGSAQEGQEAGASLEAGGETQLFDAPFLDKHPVIVHFGHRLAFDFHQHPDLTAGLAHLIEDLPLLVGIGDDDLHPARL
jgi:hypothetical protein